MTFSAFRTFLFAAASGLAIAASAQAQETQPIDYGPYISLGAGATFTHDNSPLLSDPSLPAISGTRPELKWDAGINVIGAFGYKLQDGLRFEVESGYRRSKLNGIADDPNQVGGSEGVWDFTGAGLYEFNAGPVRPYLGAGVGFGRIVADSLTDGVPGDPVFGGHDTRFEWQGIVGVNAPVTNKFSVFVEYRYISLSGASINSRDHSANLLNYNDRSNNVLRPSN